ncbi:two-component response regulator-like PRR37 isoform X1 [Juglans regia]|uniref:Two-component response regulator-like PRR37 isoform X1 n=2 Tax=Juglans regia TaxID=51240 RepID=A0A6P9EWW7_JUGRE|nr:two-component response regulator-like PRR37 isoform X1 [Juglans regia]
MQMNNNGPVTKELAELNHQMQDERKEMRVGVTGEGQGLSEEDEYQINKDAEDVDVGQSEAVQDKAHAPDVFQSSQQQPQGPVVRWERFLPRRSLQVLLVENDDSTRQVVSALLRNCGYEVTAVENGLQAWKILEDVTTHIDLVLTEVVLPCLSGIGLLCKIMNHKTCKNIPVIMMSSYDSMNIVFKCLSKGAVDFLAKPIRKNELKNLWQHVWRKCHSSSDSGSESGIHTQKSTKLKSGEESDNNTGSNDEDDIGSIDLNVRGGSDTGSGTQTSWTKRAAEVDSPLPMSLWEELDDPPDSTCAQVIPSRTEAFGNNWVPVTATREHEGQDHELDLETGISRIPNLQLENPSAKGLTNLAGTSEEKISEINSKKDDEKLQKGRVELNSEKPNGETRNQAADLVGLISNDTDPQIETVVFDIPNGISKVSNLKDKTIFDNKEIPSLELSLKRLRDAGDTGTSAHDRNVLRHSDLSAFSRYNFASSANQAPTGNVGSCSPHNSSMAEKTESRQKFRSNSNSTNPNQCSNGSSNNNDMGSTTNNVYTKQVAFSDKSAPNSAFKYLRPSSAFQPVQNGPTSPTQPIIQGKTDATIASTVSAQTRDMKQPVQVQHHHHHYHHHHHHLHNMPQQKLANQDDLSSKNIAVEAPQCGSSNMLSAPVEGKAGYQSMNGNGSRSNHGSNGQNGSITDLNARGANMESDNGVAGKGGVSGVTGFATRSGIDTNHSAQREAALNKFRQKRKERCFEKKYNLHFYDFGGDTEEISLYIIFSRSDTRAGRNWQIRDHEFEDNLFDRRCTRRKARTHIANLTCP